MLTFPTVALMLTLLAQTPPAQTPPPAPETSESEVDYFKVESAAVGRSVAVGVYLPPGYESSPERRYPVLYFLHGMFGNESVWQRRGCQEVLDAEIAAGRVEPMIVVFPAGYNGFWIDWVDGKTRWDEFLTQELIADIDRRFRTIAERTSRGVNGDSMGGYGALTLGFKHADLFGSVSSHSAMIYPVDLSNLPEWVVRNMQQFAPIYGNPVDLEHWQANHPLYLAETVDKAALARLAIYFDCGTEDRFGFDVGARQLHEVLEKRSIAHEHYLRDGNHGRDYYTKYVPFSLAFHSRNFASPVKANSEARDL